MCLRAIATWGTVLKGCNIREVKNCYPRECPPYAHLLILILVTTFYVFFLVLGVKLRMLHMLRSGATSRPPLVFYTVPEHCVPQSLNHEAHSLSDFGMCTEASWVPLHGSALISFIGGDYFISSMIHSLVVPSSTKGHLGLVLGRHHLLVFCWGEPTWSHGLTCDPPKSACECSNCKTSGWDFL